MGATGVERRKYLLEVFLRKSWPLVMDFNQNLMLKDAPVAGNPPRFRTKLDGITQ